MTSTRAIALAFPILLLAAPARAEGDEAAFESHIRASIAARDRGDLAESLAEVEAAYAMRPLPELLNNAGRLLEELGRYAEAASRYRRAAADPSSTPELVELDQARLAALAPKLDKGWLVVRADPPTTNCAVDGATFPLGAPEVGLAPGAHAIAFRARGSDEIVLRTVLLAAGARAVHAERLARWAPNDGSLSLRGVPDDAALAINRRPLGLSLVGAERVRLEAGTYLVGAPGLIEVPVPVRVDAGEAAPLADLLRSAPEAAARAEAPATPRPRAIWPWLVAGAGAAAIAGGLGARAAAGSDRDMVIDAGRDARGVVVGLTLAEADRLESRADAEATAGAVLLAAGASAVIAGAIALLFGDAP